MAWTKRSQNRCKECGYTWYPKGKSLSRVCPNCGSRNVTYAGGGCGCLALIIIGFGIFASIKSSHPQSGTVAPEPTSTPPEQPAAAQPVTLPASRSTTVADAQREAVRRYPDLGIAGSKLNTEFVARYKRYQQERPEYFRDTSWPLRLAEEIVGSTSQTRSTVASQPSTQPSASTATKADADSFLGLSESALVRRLGQPISVETHDSPDGPFKMLQFDRTKGAETFFVIFADEGKVHYGSYRGIPTTTR